MMKNGLYVLFEGLPATVIDTQVMLHVRQMREQGMVDFEVWSFAHSSTLYMDSQARLGHVQELSQSHVRLFRGIRPVVPLSGLLNAFLLWLNIRKFRPAFELIHARTDYSATVCGYLRMLIPFELIWDCRGDVEAEVREIFTHPGLFQRLIVVYQIMLARWRVYWSATTCQKAIFVTSVLKSLRAQHLGDKPFQIIPSAVSDELFFYDANLRRQTRRHLGYSEQDKVIIYSGGLSHYQCFPESIALFERLCREDSKFKLLVLTPQAEIARKMLSQLPGGSYQVFSARLDEVNNYLNAADYALMLRDYNPINASAFPTKFAEYCLAGLPVIMCSSIPEAYAMAKETGNLCEYDDNKVAFCAIADRTEISSRYQALLSRQAILPRYKALYTK